MIRKILEKRANAIRAAKALGFLNKGTKAVNKTLASTSPEAIRRTQAQAAMFTSPVGVHTSPEAYRKAMINAEGIIQHTKTGHQRGLASLVRRRLEAIGKEQ